MSKSMKLKCTSSTLVAYWQENRLYKGRVTKDGERQVQDSYGVWFELPDNNVVVGEDSGGIALSASFVELKTKTIKCTSVNHAMQTKKTFKPGKRYQIESGRALGAVAGYVYDQDGNRFTLYREEVGFSVAGGLAFFEAKYS